MPQSFAMFATAVTSTNAVSLVSLGSFVTAVIRNVTLCNAHTASTASADVYVSMAGSTNAFYLQRYTQVPANQTLEVVSQPLVLNGGDSLKVECGIVANVHAVASVLKVS